MFTRWQEKIRGLKANIDVRRSPLRLVAAFILFAFLALLTIWIVDKVLLFAFARSYVDEIAAVANLDLWTARALAWAAFAATLIVGRLAFSFSKTRRNIGIAAFVALMAGQSLVIAQLAKDKFFDRAGLATKCYVITRTTIEYRENVGIDPKTGMECRPVTPDIVERLERYQNGAQPRRMNVSDPTFFDLRTGNPIVWYFKQPDGTIELFDLMGYHPEAGRPLEPITKTIVTEWRAQRALANRKAPQRVFPNEEFEFFDPLTGKPRLWHKRAESGEFEFFDHPGFDPKTGDELAVVDRPVIAAWRAWVAENDSMRCYILTKDSLRFGNKLGVDTATGRECKAYTPQLLRRLREYEKGNRPKRVASADPTFFESASGEPALWYATGRNGEIELFDLMGFHPGTGVELLPVTKEIATKWQEQKKRGSKPAQRVNPSTFIFFDPATGEARGYYWRGDKGDIEFYDGPGFHPRTGDSLIPVTKEALRKIDEEMREAQRQAKIEEEKLRKAQADESAARERQAQEAERLKILRKEQLDQQQLAGRRCDELAANPADRNRVGEGVAYEVMRVNAREAAEACELAVKQFPDNLRFRYQLGRSLETLNRARAFELHSKLVSLNYPAAFDNLGWMYINDKKDLNTAVGLFRKGVQLGDSDSMISIADLLEKGRIGPTSPDETRLKLLTRAADLGNPNAIRAVQVELEKEQIARQNKALEIERQRQAAEIFGQVLRQFAR